MINSLKWKSKTYDKKLQIFMPKAIEKSHLVSKLLFTVFSFPACNNQCNMATFKLIPSSLAWEKLYKQQKKKYCKEWKLFRKIERRRKGNGKLERKKKTFFSKIKDEKKSFKNFFLLIYLYTEAKNWKNFPSNVPLYSLHCAIYSCGKIKYRKA